MPKPFRPLSQIEMKMLIFNKVKRGMTYDEAKKQLSTELKQMYQSHSFAKSREEGQVADLSCPPNLKIQKGGKNGKRNERRSILPV